MVIGLLGTGMIVNDLLQTYQKLGVEKTYIFSTKRSEEKAKELVVKYGLDGNYTDYDELLNTDVEVIYVGLPNSLHFQFGMKALEAGKHVIMEKPITANAKELELLMKTAKEHHVMLFEAMTVHHLPAYRALKEDVKKLGDIRIATFNFSQYSSRYNAFLAGDIKPAFDPKMCGGALMDLNVYNVHAAMGIFGTPNRSTYHGNMQKNIDTSGILSLDYGDKQVMCIGAKDCSAPILSTIQGEKGTILIKKQVSLMDGYTVIHADGSQKEKDFTLTEHRMYYEFMDFLRMIQEGDFTGCQELLELSLSVSKVMQEGRLDAGIVFDNDREMNLA